MKEFEIIDKYFRPLSNYQTSYCLADDASIFKEELPIIQTTDNLVAGVHFFENDSAKNIAKKAMAVNLSDIASMGAIPKYYTLCISLPKNNKIDDKWLLEFSLQLKKIQNKYNIVLIGGNTVFYNGPLNISINMIGVLSSRDKKPLLQNTASLGDSIYISNTVGDSYFGLQHLISKNSYYRKYFLNYISSFQKRYKLSNQDISFLHKAFYSPQPQILLGQILSKFTNCCTDISDGLWKDLEKICLHSNVLGKIYLENFVFSKVVSKIINRHDKKSQLKTKIDAISNGEDYQLLFTVNKSKEKSLIMECQKFNIFIQKIGEISDKSTTNYGLDVYYNNIRLNSLFPKRGYEHSSK